MIISNFQVVEVNCSSMASLPDRWESHLALEFSSATASSVAWCSLQGRPCGSTLDVHHVLQNAPETTKKGGNYTEETDRHVPIELGSVNVHWLKVQQCLLAGWAWRQTTAHQAECSTSDVVAHGNHAVMFKVKNVVYVTITQMMNETFQTFHNNYMTLFPYKMIRVFYTMFSHYISSKHEGSQLCEYMLYYFFASTHQNLWLLEFLHSIVGSPDLKDRIAHV